MDTPSAIHITVTHKIDFADGTLASIDELIEMLITGMQSAAQKIVDRSLRVPVPAAAAATDRTAPASAQVPASVAAAAPLPRPAPPAPAAASAPLPARPSPPPAASQAAPRQPLAPPFAQAVAPKPNPAAAAPQVVSDNRLYTPERDEVMRRHFPVLGASDRLLDLLNKLPGRQYEKSQQASNRATQLGLRRSADPAAMAARRADEAEIETQRAAMKRPAPAALMPTNSRMTPERVDVLTREWPRGTSTKEIDQLLRELPGAAIPFEQIATYAASLGLRRPSVGTLDTSHREPPRGDTPVSATETVDWPAARQWAKANSIEFPVGTTLRAARLIINDARAARHLNAWNIVDARGVTQPLPSPTLGGAVHAP